jgi:hypothetical protein
VWVKLEMAKKYCLENPGGDIYERIILNVGY